MNALIRPIAVGLAALGLSLPALAETPASAPEATVRKPAATAKVRHRKAHKVAQAAPNAEEKKVEAKPAAKPEPKPAAKPDQKPAAKPEQKPAEKPAATPTTPSK